MRTRITFRNDKYMEIHFHKMDFIINLKSMLGAYTLHRTDSICLFQGIYFTFQVEFLH